MSKRFDSSKHLKIHFGQRDRIYNVLNLVVTVGSSLDEINGGDGIQRGESLWLSHERRIFIRALGSRHVIV